MCRATGMGSPIGSWQDESGDQEGWFGMFVFVSFYPRMTASSLSGGSPKTSASIGVKTAVQHS